jgi:hypothetical protein
MPEASGNVVGAVAGRENEGFSEEAIEEMAKRDKRGHALTIEGSAGNQVMNPLLRIAKQPSNDMFRYGAALD